MESYRDIGGDRGRLMNIKLQKKLFKKYPRLFVHKDTSVQQSSMAFGIETGDGWYNLLDNLCSWIYFNMEANCHSYPVVEFTQIKEKFGLLRIYYSARVMTEKEYNETKKYHILLPSTYYRYCGKTTLWQKIKRYALKKYYGESSPFDGAEGISGAICFAEYLSGTICEICGKPGKTVEINKWYSTLCPECEKNERKRRKFI